MTVLPFPAHRTLADRPGPPLQPRATTAVQGSFASPDGGTGTFCGTYVLEHFLARSGRVGVRGVFTGELVDARGQRVGVAARRRTTPVELSAVDTCLLARVEGLDVDLNGLLVAVEPLEVHVEGTSAERVARAALRLPFPTSAGASS